MQGLGDWLGAVLTYPPALVGRQVCHVPFHAVQGAEQLQRLFGDLALVARMQVMELAPGKRAFGRVLSSAYA